MNPLILPQVFPTPRVRRVVVLFFSLTLLWFLQTQSNHYLAPWRISLFLGGLFVAFPALHGQGRPGLIAVVLSGFLFDAAAPVWNGLHPLLFAVAYLAIRNVRDRLPREETTVRVLVALAANLAIFLVISFAMISRFPDGTAAWGRLFADLMASQIVIALIGPWFFSLQRRALQVTRAEPKPID